MHIQANPRTWQVELTNKEIDLITYGLSLHAANPGTKKDKVEECSKLAQQFMNARNQA